MPYDGYILVFLLDFGEFNFSRYCATGCDGVRLFYCCNKYSLGKCGGNFVMNLISHQPEILSNCITYKFVTVSNQVNPPCMENADCVSCERVSEWCCLAVISTPCDALSLCLLQLLTSSYLLHYKELAQECFWRIKRTHKRVNPSRECFSINGFTVHRITPPVLLHPFPQKK